MTIRTPFSMPDDDPIVAIGLLTQNDLNLLGSGFRRAFHVTDDCSMFDELLAAIDVADMHMPPTRQG